jgi:N-acetylated-alpha-linked acidic dipeptidase
MRRSVLCGISLVLIANAALAQDGALQRRFDANLSVKDQAQWLKMTSSEPNQVGSPHDKTNAEWILSQYKRWGWDAHIETYEVLYPTPISEAVEMGNFKATLQEKPIPGDTSATAKDYALPAYLAYQGDGDVAAPLVYVNFGTEADYLELARMGVSVRGKIAIARYGEVWRGVKPLLAAKHGAIGCIIYSDPADDGYGQGETYPKGAMRPPQGIQRGSAMDMMLYPGDPLTPGVAATASAKRLTRKTAPSLLTIPALPISYADAQVLLAAMSGPVAPRNWRGGLGITYHVGGGSSDPAVHLAVKSNWDLKPVRDVIATIKGSVYPDQWVIRGNHFDGWVEGASDPLSGQVALLDEARSIGALVKAGWKPKRTIIYTSWDGEEPMLLGSTEWAEDHAKELQQKAVIYINTDGNSRGFLRAEASQDLGKFFTRTAMSVTDPETGVSLASRTRAKYQTLALATGASPETKDDAKLAADPTSSLPLGALGSGSDFSTFIDHLGIATLNLGFGGEEPGGGVYHSRYDTFEHHTRFDDPGLAYGKALATTGGHAVLDAADADLPLVYPEDFAKAMAGYATKVEKLADSRRKEAQEQKKLLASNAFVVSADPTKPHGMPVVMKEVPDFDFKPLDVSIAQLTKSAKNYETEIAAKEGKLTPAQKAQLQGIMQTIDQTLLNQEGLPGRGWYKNLVYAPGRYIGYGVTTLPGVTEAITEERWSDVPKYIGLTALAFNAYAARLDAAVALLSKV